jgi:glycosyltransferase involved in cell wall biosynthesis
MKIATAYMAYPGTGKGGAESWWDMMSKFLLRVDPEAEYLVYTNDRGREFFTTESERIMVRNIAACSNQVSRILWHEFILPAYLNKDKIDILLTLSGTSVFPCKSKCHNVVVFHDLGEYYIKKKYDPFRLFYRKNICIPLSINRADKIVTVSENTKNDLIKLRNIPEEKITVIYNGPSAFGYQEKPLSGERLRHKWGLGNSSFLFSPCRTDYIGKGLDALLQGYKIILDRDPGFPPLVVTGAPGMGHEDFVRAITHLGLGKKVRWLGWVSPEEMEAFYREAALLVFASKYEGFGFPLTEAMARGLPVACSRVASLPELGGEAVAYFDPNSPADIAAVLTRLLADNRLLEQLRERGFEQVKKFDWENSARKLFSLFKELL